jgi:hypothetical protein
MSYRRLVKITFLYTFSAAILLLGASPAVHTQNEGFIPGKGITLKPTVYTTAPKTVIAQLKNGGQDASDIAGNITFTVTAANSDDSVTGTLNYTIPNEARQKIAAYSGQALGTVPLVITRQKVIASFEQATAPPVLHLLIGTMEMDVMGVKVHFPRITVDINARAAPETLRSSDEVEALFTLWARQIHDGRPRRGIIYHLNRLIAGL